MPKYDWPLLKAEYVEGILNEDGSRKYPSTEDLAERHKINHTYLRRISAKELWLQQRNILITKIQEARQKEVVNILASKGAEFDSKSLQVAEAGIVMVARQLKKVATKEDAPCADLQALGAALKSFQHVGRLALGESTDNQGGFGGGTLIANKIEVVFREENGRD